MTEHRYRLGALVMLVTTVLPSAQAAVSRLKVQSHATSAAAYPTVFGVPGSSQGGQIGTSKLDGALRAIAQRYPTIPADRPLSSLQAINPAAHFRLSSPLATPEVAIDAITTGDPLALKAALQRLGLRDVAIFSNDVGGWLPVDAIASAGVLTELHFARASMPRTRAAIATQGDFAQGSAAVRTTYPALTGAGVMVGILSDSFNCYSTYAGSSVPASGLNGYASNGFTATYANDQSSGAVPAGVKVLEEANCLNYGAPVQLPFTDEGRAILQIVHAVAPNASLAFHTAVSSEADFASGIVALAAAGARVIDDDVGYPDEPFFQDGVIAQAINQVAAQGVAYFSSAGNDGRFSYENNAPLFPLVSTSAPNNGEQLLNFDSTGATTTTSLPITIPALFPGEFLSLIVEWDEPFVTGAPASGGASSSLDLCLTGSAGGDQITDDASFPNTVTCTGLNRPGVDPVQIMFIGNPANAKANTALLHTSISIGLKSGSPVPGRLKFVLAGNGAGATIDRFQTYSPTLQGHPAATGAAAVGAAAFYNTPACGPRTAQLESFSSAGGTPILFDVNGARLATPQVRQKPDFVAPDGVNNTFLGYTLKDAGITFSAADPACQNSAAYPNFFGTSAAAPHAAAAAALMLQANPDLTPTQIFNALRTTAVAMNNGTPNVNGYNPDDGFGFISVEAAFSQLPGGAPYLAMSPTSVVVGTAAALTWAAINATSCTASGSWSGTQSASGTQTFTPTAPGTNTYTLTCNSPRGSTTGSATLTAQAMGGSGNSGSGGGGGSLDEMSLLSLGALLFARWLPLIVRKRVRRIH